jgi:hypothetical protein
MKPLRFVISPIICKQAVASCADGQQRAKPPAKGPETHPDGKYKGITITGLKSEARRREVDVDDCRLRRDFVRALLDKDEEDEGAAVEVADSVADEVADDAADAVAAGVAAEVTVAADRPTYARMKVADLKGLTTTRGIILERARMRKAEIIDRLEAWDAEQEREQREQAEADAREKEERKRERAEREDFPEPAIPELVDKWMVMTRPATGEDEEDKKGWYDLHLEVDGTEDDGTWECAKHVGEGAYGACSLWVKKDAGENIIDVSTIYLPSVHDILTRIATCHQRPSCRSEGCSLHPFLGAW